MKKRAIGLFLCVCMLLGLLPQVALAAVRVRSITFNPSTVTLIYDPGSPASGRSTIWADIDSVGGEAEISRWKSSNDGIVTVRERNDGRSALITAKSVGTATITAYYDYDDDNGEGQSIVGICTVVVKPPPVLPAKVVVSSDSNSTIVDEGNTLQLVAEVFGDEEKTKYADDTSVTWESNKPNIATVDRDTGLVTAVKKGDTNGVVVITATAKTRGSGDQLISGTIRVNVKPPTTVSIEPADSTATVGSGSSTSPYELNNTAGTLVLTAAVANSENAVSWVSNNPSVVTVTGSDEKNTTGTVKFVSPGTATITATVDGKKASCTVEAYRVATRITKGSGETGSDDDPMVLELGSTKTLHPEVELSDSAVVWSTDADNRVSLEPIGTECEVTAIPSDTIPPATLVTVTISAKGGDESTSYKFKLIQKSSGIKLSPASHTLIADGAEGKNQVTLTAQFDPANTSDRSITWSSNDADNKIIEVVPVSGDSTKAVVTAKGAGSAIVTATAANEKKSTATITVRRPVKTVTVTAADQTTVTAGTKLSLTCATDPDPATVVSVAWNVSNLSVAELGDSNAGMTKTINTKKPGTAEITAKVTTIDSNNNSTTVSGSITLTVTALAVNTITMKPVKATVSKGGTLNLSATLSPANASNRTVCWASGDTTRATVNENGRVTGVEPTEAGKTVTIYAWPKEWGETLADVQAKDAYKDKIATCALTVTNVPVTGITLTPANPVTCKVGEKATFTSHLAPSGAISTVSWGPSSSSVFDLEASEDGKTAVVTAKEPGEDTVTATAEGHTASCKVTVPGVVLDRKSVSIAIGETFIPSKTLYGTAKGLNETDWEWTSNNDTVARVNPSSGAITGVSKGTATITCENGGYSAKVTITVSDSGGIAIKQTLKEGELDFVDFINEFKTQCSDALDSSIDYVTGLSVSPAQGTLYYGFVSDSDTGAGIAANDKFYYSTSKTPSAVVSNKLLSRVIFVPKAGFSGTATISYTGFAASGKSYAGSIQVSVKIPAELSYTSTDGGAIYFSSSDFTTDSQARQGFPISSVRFTPPSERYGFLYYDYSGGSIYGSNVSSTTRYYSTSTPSLDKVAFVPRANYAGSFVMSYSGTDTNGDTYQGSIRINVKNSEATQGDISYTASAGHRLYFDVSDFEAYCKSMTGGDLQYVNFTRLPDATKAILYHSTGTKAGDKLSTGTSYYVSTKYSHQKHLEDVNLLPMDETIGALTLPFTGSSKVPTPGTPNSYTYETFNGSLVVNVTKNHGSAATIYYTSSGMPVVFRRTDFDDACKDEIPGKVTKVSFQPPSAMAGTLYESFTNLVDKKALPSGKQLSAGGLTSMVYLPKGTSSGSTYISYTAYDDAGNSCEGDIRVTVSAKNDSEHFTDMTNAAWAASSVDFLYTYGIVTGSGSKRFFPASPMKRGDFILMLSRAFSLGSSGAESFSDVPQGSYYASAIASAKAKGLVKGSGGNFNPNSSITRQEASTILYRLFQMNGTALPGYSNTLSNFRDADQIASYAKDAMASMVRMGLIQGSGVLLSPSKNLTRAEMATILHRAVT